MSKVVAQLVLMFLAGQKAGGYQMSPPEQAQEAGVYLRMPNEGMLFHLPFRRFLLPSDCADLEQILDSVGAKMTQR